ncbi:MAG: hypothetical protein R3F39_04420 [Myxococcota bacterium]
MRALLIALATASLTAGCGSNPTPHPIGYDGGGGSLADVALPRDGASQGPNDDAREVCVSLGGAFNDEGVCQVEIETAFDGEPSVPSAGGGDVRADVTDVAITGDPGAYTFAVTVQSGDTGCDGYADWWEVLALDGTLRYRRVLTHSHVSEQPFTRSGGPVPVAADDVVIIRAHRHPEGYGGSAWLGTVSGGFTVFAAPPDLASTLASQEPLPAGCAR